MNVSYAQFEPSARSVLRSATAVDHEIVDAAYGRFRLATRTGYSGFLIAHARILPVAERVLDPGSLLPDWVGRTQALLSDLDALGLDRPEEITFPLPQSEGARWGAIYVLEGSRLGGDMLSRTVPSRYPSTYLESRHGQGQWRALVEQLDEADEGPHWQREAIAGAKSLFGAYLEAARG